MKTLVIQDMTNIEAIRLAPEDKTLMKGLKSSLPTLDLTRILCQELDDERIAYCHWKSNAALDRSAAGTNDLDLLIAESDALRFRAILRRLGFREAWLPTASKYPGITHFYGYDARSGIFVHVHAHFQLIVGDDNLKNYHLRLEDAFLRNTVQEDIFKVPVPELELIVFVIRMILKRPFFDFACT